MPGLFSRYGALGNPIVDLLGAASIANAARQGSEAAQARALQPDVQSLMFANAAYQQGQLLDQAPRAPGLFSNLGVKLGMLSPTVAPRAKDVQEELKVLADRRKQQQDTISKEVDWATKVGYKNFQNMEAMPAVQQMSMFATGGEPTIGITGPTVREEAINAVNAQRDFTRRADLLRLGLAVDELQLRNAAFERKKLEPIPFSPEWLRGEAARTTEVTAARERELSREDSADWGFFHRHHPNQSFVDSDFNTIDESKVTPGQAMNDHVHYILMHNVQQQNMANTTRALIDTLTNLRNNVLPKVMVDTTGMSAASARAAVLGKWAEMSTVGRFSNEMSQFNQIGSDSMAYGKLVQNRYATTREIEYIKEGNMPLLRTDNLVQGQNKLDQLIRDIRIAGGVAIDRAGIVDGRNTAESDFFKAISPEPIPAPAAEAEPPSVVPPMPPEPSGMAELGRIGAGEDMPSDVERGPE